MIWWLSIGMPLLLVDEKADFEENLYIMELANLQLAELRGLTTICSMTRWNASYREFWPERFAQARRGRPPGTEGNPHRFGAPFSDELSNITKFLRRLAPGANLQEYRRPLPPGRLASHESTKNSKNARRALPDPSSTDQNNRWMLLLELTIVLLFIIDLDYPHYGLQGAREREVSARSLKQCGFARLPRLALPKPC